MRNPSDTRWRVVKISGLALFIITVIGGAVALNIMRLRPAIDAADLCQTRAILRESRVVLVDATDPLSLNQQRQLKSAIVVARDNTVVGGKLILSVLDSAAPYEPREIIAKCNPGSSVASNPLFVTGKRIDKRWRDAFAAPIDEAIASLGSSAPAKVSPIIEAVTAMTQRPDFDRRVEKRSLVVVSDLVQHSGSAGGLSQYTGSGDLWSEFKRSRLAAEAQPDLRGVDVEIVYLVRPELAKLQSRRHREFWRKWFENAGAATVKFVGIPDDGPESLAPTQGKMPSTKPQIRKALAANARLLTAPPPSNSSHKYRLD